VLQKARRDGQSEIFVLVATPSFGECPNFFRIRLNEIFDGDDRLPAEILLSVGCRSTRKNPLGLLNCFVYVHWKCPGERLAVESWRNAFFSVGSNIALSSFVSTAAKWAALRRPPWPKYMRDSRSRRVWIERPVYCVRQCDLLGNQVVLPRMEVVGSRFLWEGFDMRKVTHRANVTSLAAAAVLFGTLCLVATARAEPSGDGAAGWTDDFSAETGDLVATGRNPYFVLEPGYVLVLDDGAVQLTVTVKNETTTIDGVECRVVEEREVESGKVIEVSNNYFAISRRTNSAYYFGEDTGGAWRSGANGARFGLMMPGLPLVGAKHYQEIAPGAAMDRAEIVSVSETVKTPAGEFKNCLKVEETTPLEPGEKEYKYYAPGIGLIQDGPLKLVKYGTLGTTPK